MLLEHCLTHSMKKYVPNLRVYVSEKLPNSKGSYVSKILCQFPPIYSVFNPVGMILAI